MSDYPEFSGEAKGVKPGTYRHFKGFICTVYGVGHHTETEEELVLYEHDGRLWARPLAMFLEHVERDNYSGPRFIRIEDAAAS